MDLLTLIGTVVHGLPGFVKDWLEKVVFVDEYEGRLLSLIRRKYYYRTGLVLGGCVGREEEALRLYGRGLVQDLVLSGGIGRYSENQEIAEAKLCRDYLFQHGVPTDCMTLEANSRTTYENLWYSLPILAEKARSLPSYEPLLVVLVTNHFHARRAEMLFEIILREYKKTDPIYDKIKLAWSNADFFGYECSQEHWRESIDGCALVGKEAIRILQVKLFKKG